MAHECKEIRLLHQISGVSLTPQSYRRKSQRNLNPNQVGTQLVGLNKFQANQSVTSLHSLHIQTTEGDAGGNNERLEDGRMGPERCIRKMGGFKLGIKKRKI